MFILVVLLVALASLAVGVCVVIVKKKLHFWLWPYVVQSIRAIGRKPPAERHIIVAICDHFDFGSHGVYVPGEERILKAWETHFPPLAARHRDTDGACPKHTWFFPPHVHRADYLERLVGLCARGLGEVELHLHHDHLPPFQDTSTTLREKIRSTVLEYGKHGVFCLPDGRRAFAFIHGDWALDNSRSGRYCGVNDEIRILAEEGCYADFTFPSLHEAQPSKINSIYYATDDPERPKSYNTGTDVVAGGRESGDLLIIEGPLGLRTKRRFGIPFFPAIEAAELEGASTPSGRRAKVWIEANVHVKGRPEWVFVKLHTHGGMSQNFSHNFGELAEAFFTELEGEYRTPQAGLLHYVTAREMYNIIKAAEAGEAGNPNEYRDYRIPRYTYVG